MAEIGQVLNRLKGVQKSGEGWVAFCPAHENTRTQALSVTEGRDGLILFKCHSQECSFSSIAHALGFEEKELMGGNGVVPIRESVTLAALSAKVGIASADLERFGWKETNSGTAVAIPYRDGEGAHLYSKLRISLDGGPKYKVYPAGKEQVAYGLWLLRKMRQRSPQRLFLVEGESDSVTLWHHGIAALGIPGSSAVAGTLRPLYLKGFDEVYAVQESDPAGAKFVERIAAHLERPIKVVRFPEGINDTNDLHREDPQVFRAAFLNLAHDAETYSNTTDTQRIIFLSEIDETETRHDFLWDPYIPAGVVSLLAGAPGIGKSLATVAIASALTRGFALPGLGDLQTARRSSVLFLAGEDDPRRVILPRAKKAGADLTRLAVVDREEWPINLWLDESIQELTGVVRQSEIGLVVIDPIQQWVSAEKFSMNSATDVRRVMGALGRMCSDTGATAVVVAHDRKGEVASSIDAVLGSRDFTAASRSVLMMFRHPTKPRHGILTHAKHNYSAAGPSLEYQVDDHEGRPSVVWTGPIDMTAEDLIQEKVTGQDLEAREEAVEILRAMMREQDRIEVKEAIREGKAHGISASTMRRAKKLVGLKPRKLGTKWYWVPTHTSTETAEQDAVPF